MMLSLSMDVSIVVFMVKVLGTAPTQLPRYCVHFLNDVHQLSVEHKFSTYTVINVHIKIRTI